MKTTGDHKDRTNGLRIFLRPAKGRFLSCGDLPCVPLPGDIVEQDGRLYAIEKRVFHTSSSPAPSVELFCTECGEDAPARAGGERERA